MLILFIVTGVIATFLHVHPFGATVDYISSYLSRLGIVIRSSELEDLLEQLPTVFTLEIKGVGASIEKLWTFTAFSLEKNTESWIWKGGTSALNHSLGIEMSCPLNWYPENTIHCVCSNAGLMLGQCHRCWAGLKPTLFLVFIGWI